MFLHFFIGFVGLRVERRADEGMRRSRVRASVPEFHRVSIRCAAILPMNAHGDAVAARAPFHHAPDLDGAQQRARPALVLGMGSGEIQTRIMDAAS